MSDSFRSEPNTNAWHTPLPAELLNQIASTVRSHEARDDLMDTVHGHSTFKIVVSAFPGDNGEQCYAIDVFDHPRVVTPGDRRSKKRAESRATTYYFDAVGRRNTDDPSVWTSHE